MSSSMPFIVARGNNFFSAIEKRTFAERQAGLANLLAGRSDALPLWNAPATTSFGPADKCHLQRHWFGDPPVVPGSKVGLPPIAPTRPTTGWWSDWYGDAHEIVRQTMQRAYQVALGSPSDTQVNATRNWPITVLWICGAAFFHGVVLWDDHGNGDGHVTVAFATPMVDHDYKDPTCPSPYIEMLRGVMGPEAFSFGPGDHAFAAVGHESSVRVQLRRFGTSKHYVATPDDMYEQQGNSPTIQRIKQMERNSEKWGSSVPAGTPSMPAFIRVSRGAVITVRQP
jgi:hypothetical protein